MGLPSHPGSVIEAVGITPLLFVANTRRESGAGVRPSSTTLATPGGQK
jgi:hypothetical protein